MEHAVITTSVPGHSDVAPAPVGKLILVASIAAGVQFGWALQLSLLTPYVQTLGVPHTWSSFIWLCGPLSGLLVQPIVGYFSDRCTSRFGRRRPFIISGAILVTLAVFLIGWAADMGRQLGDSPDKKTKPRAVTFFVIGFWVLDVANNTLQGPCRAFLADLSANNHAKISAANAFFSFFMAIGNVLGYAAGSYPKLHKIFPFTKTDACDIYCANLKSCFIFSILFLIVLSTIACIVVKETPITKEDLDNNEGSSVPFFGQLCTAVKVLPKPMWILFLVTSLNWIGWFPFILYDTDWMGREIYGGDPSGTEVQSELYDKGVNVGSLGLMLYAVVLGVVSLAIEPLAKCLGHVKRVWGIGNLILAICLALTYTVTKWAEKARGASFQAPPKDVKATAVGLFAAFGIPQAVTYSIPFALASIYSSTCGAGQGLSLGLLNISICIPQMIVSVIVGPLDEAFGGGNIPGFIFGAIASAISAICAFTILPNSARSKE